jgi:uncharacterized protein
MADNQHFYVYVYIDPRNLEEFYYGKGKGSRKTAHLSDESDSEKAIRIKAIHKAGLTPIIKVISTNLTESEAFLIEKTLIWKLGRTLTNISGGHFADKFRPHDTLHEDLAGFDYKNGVYYVNVGEGNHRCWEDCMQFSFLSAGQHKKYSDPIRTLEPGDIVIAYLKGCGFVGVGKVEKKAIRISDFRHNGKSLNDLPLKIKNMFNNSGNEKSEFILKVKWLKAFERKDAKWVKKSDLFTTRQIKASLQSQKKTLDFINKEFDMDIITLLKQD